MASEVDIVNRALSLLGAARITALSDDSRAARAMNAAYDIERDAELQAHPWRFARTRIQLAADATAPLFDYATACTLPADCLRILPYTGADWVEEDGKLLTNDSAPLDLLYIKRQTDTAKFHALFIRALAARLALETCFEITESNTRYRDLQGAYQAAIREARKANAFTGPAEEMPESDYITVRTGLDRTTRPYSN